MRNSKQKLKLLYLIQIFDEYTDEEHGITMSEIIKKLDDNGIKAERKSIYDDIEQLGTVGYEIVTEKLNRETVYKTVTRKFDVSELKMLVDVVQASKFISKKDSEETNSITRSGIGIYKVRTSLLHSFRRREPTRKTSLFSEHRESTTHYFCIR